MKSDIEIARSIPLKDIDLLAKEYGIPTDKLEHYGRYIAKVSLDLQSEEKIQHSNLILVTSITPTKAGIGKTTVSIGLALGLNKLGKKTIVALREPSLGPCFGMKGGAAGGGYSQVLPMEKINLHFTGDFHAITSAHNMISALLDNYLYQNKEAENKLKHILWKRVLDVNDRSLRNIITGLGGAVNGIPQESGFDITPASEIMAVLCLSENLQDLENRIGNMILGYKHDNSAFLVKDLGIAPAITVLLKDALQPNLVQTTENTLAFIHGGPFANIAHGCNSIIATKMAMSFSDYTITEAGFGADLGAEKFFNIKCRKAKIQPKLTVIVVTSQALKMHGGISLEKIKIANLQGLKNGFENLAKHIENIKSFGQDIVVAFNKHSSDNNEEIQAVKEFCNTNNVGFAVNNSYAKGGIGGLDLAKQVIDRIFLNRTKQLQFTYDNADSTIDKITKIAKKIYGANKVIISEKAQKKLNLVDNYNIPICIAKTQFSFSNNQNQYGVAKNFDIEINDILLNNGAGFLVAIAGNIMRMPGLPKTPQAFNIKVVNGKVEGLS